MSKKLNKRAALAEKVPFSRHIYETGVSILIGIGIGLLFTGAVGLATRDSLPTRFIFEYSKSKLGIESDQPAINPKSSPYEGDWY